MDLFCEEHPNDTASGIAANCMLCKALQRLKQKDEQTKQKYERIQQMEARFPTFGDIASRPIHVPNETDSSAHTDTGHYKAKHKTMKMPTVELPDSFWEYRPKFKFPTQINSEAHVNAKLMDLIAEISNGLGLEGFIHAMLDVPVMDTAPDVTLTTKGNKNMLGSVEGKKHPKTEEEKAKIFGSDTEVAGEAFEQLFLLHLQNETFAVGLVATLQSFQLTCTKDISERPKLTPDAATEYFKAQKQGGPPDVHVTPNKPKALTTAVNISKKQKVEKQKVETTQAPKKQKGTPKNGSICVEIKNANIKREYFATEPISFSSDETDNRKVFELLAGFVILCVESLMEAPKEPVDLSVPNARCMSREVGLGRESFSFKQIQFPSGVQFDSQPRRMHLVFHVIRQLGFGQSGACCFSCTEATSAPCVIKFYRKNHSIEHATAEAAKWHNVYGNLGFDFVRAEELPRVLLIMPFLRVPCNLAERQKLVEGEEDSLLYKALQHIAGRGYIHTEVFWHHVGLIKVITEEQRQSHQQSHQSKWACAQLSCMSQGAKRGTTDAIVSTEIAVFCDLSHAEKCDDQSGREGWVKSSFKAMKSRMGHNPIDIADESR